MTDDFEIIGQRECYMRGVAAGRAELQPKYDRLLSFVYSLARYDLDNLKSDQWLQAAPDTLIESRKLLKELGVSE